jgi:hypothetical protein
MDNTKAHTALCRSIVRYIFEIGGNAYKNLGGLGQRKGRPDIEGCVKGRYVAIEPKTGTGKLSPDQERERDRILDAGGIFIEARSFDDVEQRFVAEGLAQPCLLS